MTREEAIHFAECLKNNWTINFADMEEFCDIAIEALQEVQKHEETFEWCTDCKEYDKDNYCCHRWTKVIRNTVEELKEYYDGFVEVVLCKDCKWQKFIDCGMGDCLHPKGSRHIAYDNHYCSYGERREP